MRQRCVQRRDRVLQLDTTAEGLAINRGSAANGPCQIRPSELELLSALYADPKVRRVLDRHGVPVVTLTEPAWRRFPAPQPLSADLVSDLYAGCGLSLHHIELLTGRPAAAVGAVLRAKGIPLRRAGRSSPFLRRWRQAQE